MAPMWMRWLLCCLVALVGAARLVEARDSPHSVAPAVGEIRVDDLPREAQSTLSAIRRGGPFRFEKDGVTFFNREGLLPRQPRGYYTEYTVMTPGAADRGARRIVAGGNPLRSGEYYYTADHYRSFMRIRE
jgi:ribonuclease T1